MLKQKELPHKPGGYFLSSLDNGKSQVASPPPVFYSILHTEAIFTSLESSFEHINFLSKLPMAAYTPHRVESKFLNRRSQIHP